MKRLVLLFISACCCTLAISQNRDYHRIYFSVRTGYDFFIGDAGMKVEYSNYDGNLHTITVGINFLTRQVNHVKYI